MPCDVGFPAAMTAGSSAPEAGRQRSGIPGAGPNRQSGKRVGSWLRLIHVLTGCSVFIIAACSGAVAAGSGAKPAQPATPVYRLLGFSLSGTKRVDTDALVASLPQHAGDKITAAEIKADADRIRAVLAARHVHGDMTTALLEREGKGHHIWVIWDVHLADALSYAPANRKRHFAAQSFSGNVRLSAQALALATGLHPGDAMPDGSLSDARTGIEQAYDAATHGAPVEVRGKVKVRKGNLVEIAWQITEPK